MQAICVARMIYAHLLDLDELEEMVDRLKARYTKARDARQPSAALWNEYARLLHYLRLRKRRMKDD